MAGIAVGSSKHPPFALSVNVVGEGHGTKLENILRATMLKHISVPTRETKEKKKCRRRQPTLTKKLVALELYIQEYAGEKCYMLGRTATEHKYNAVCFALFGWVSSWWWSGVWNEMKSVCFSFYLFLGCDDMIMG